MDQVSRWESFPRRNLILFLLAVFFVFASFGFVSDSVDLGRQNTLRFALSVAVSGLFSVAYAGVAIRLRHKFWIPFIPLFLAHIGIMGVIANRLPDAPSPAQYDAAATVLMHKRITFDGLAVIVCVSLGYAGFTTVSISEARRYGRLQGEKALLEGEMIAAREIQRVMVPDNLPPTPGYKLESIYRPAAQVGGDFFQVMPLKSGLSLVIVGDVSGKGLSAAMIVSMLVGMVRTITAFTEEPAEILVELNRRLCGRTHGSFATCVAVRLEPQGRLAIANAGHLPPYLNGVEAGAAASLPLGVVEASTYEQTEHALANGDRLLLLTDGIVEAQDSHGHLLGFSRVEALMRQGATARELADTAQSHGQADDITVLSIERGPQEEPDLCQPAGAAVPAGVVKEYPGSHDRPYEPGRPDRS